jgi:hypothetical protein
VGKTQKVLCKKTMYAQLCRADTENPIKGFGKLRFI